MFSHQLMVRVRHPGGDTSFQQFSRLWLWRACQKGRPNMDSDCGGLTLLFHSAPHRLRCENVSILTAMVATFQRIEYRWKRCLKMGIRRKRTMTRLSRAHVHVMIGLLVPPEEGEHRSTAAIYRRAKVAVTSGIDESYWIWKFT